MRLFLHNYWSGQRHWSAGGLIYALRRFFTTVTTGISQLGVIDTIMPCWVTKLICGKCRILVVVVLVCVYVLRGGGGLIVVQVFNVFLCFFFIRIHNAPTPPTNNPPPPSSLHHKRTQLSLFMYVWLEFTLNFSFTLCINL